MAMASGGGGGKGLKGIVAEYVKTQLQLDEKGEAKKYTGVADCVKKTIRSHGVLGLYRGLSVLLYGSIPKAAVRFGSYEMLKSFIQDKDQRVGPYGGFLCGLGAGICEALFVVTPMETIKVKFISDQRSANPKFRGFKGVYQGLAPTVMRQGSNQAVRFFVMVTLKDWYRGDNRDAYVPTYIVGGFGVVAGAASVFVNNPVDVVKTRMQSLEASKYKGFVDCFSKILIQEGFTAFYKGTVPRLFRVGLDVAVTFMLYDTFMELFDKIWP
ncbi:hypothetical protein AAG570_012390 [Ranatra chinensis]|uniref:Citrate transport protein n=1 Tax=Ranatra chinensis TaxID=642074 RepID=A0ABD0Z4Y6_9HEMI